MDHTGRRLVATAGVVLVAFIANAKPFPGSPDEIPAPDLAGAQEESGPAQSGNAFAASWQLLGQGAAARGIGVSIVYDGEAFANTTGGVRRGEAYVGNLRLQLTVDGERLLGWRGATLFLQGLQTHGGHPSRFVGDAQGVSNLDAPGGWQLYEAWLQQNLFGDRASALVGRYDLNSEFYRLQSAALFVNSSFGVGPEFSQSGRAARRFFPTPRLGCASLSSPLGASFFGPRSSTASLSTARTEKSASSRRETACCSSGRPLF